MSPSSVSYLWREPSATARFTTGVSLHSHTNQSRETLDFIADLSTDWAILQPLMRFTERRCSRLSGIRPDYAQGFWTPPLPPGFALDLERTQIESLHLGALVSLSDHDTLRAPQMLRTASTTSAVPLSVEWTVPFSHPFAAPGAESRPTCFHLGVHNLPAAAADDWMERFAAYTALTDATCNPARRDALLSCLLAALHDLPDVLVIFNHPLWDLYRIGNARHQLLVNEFLARHGQFLHALELNGLRNWNENREVAALASRWNMLTISGGDRHGIEPNANLNLSSATCFAGFVHELRRDRQSHVLFMPQYAQPWKHRILQSTLDAIRSHPHLPAGSQHWDERVFHPDAHGRITPLAQLWTSGAPTPLIAGILTLVRLLGARPVSGGLRLAWSRDPRETEAMHLALAAKA